MDEKGKIRLHPSRYSNNAAIKRNVHWCCPEEGTPFEAVLEDAYWTHVAERNLRIGDKIEVHAPDGAYYAELLVRDTGPKWAKVALLNKVDLGEPAESASIDAEFIVERAGPIDKFRVRRVSDKVIMEKGFQTKDAAQLWVINHSKPMAA